MIQHDNNYGYNMTHDTELLNEIINIITRHLLTNPDFCGSTEGRRLQEIAYRLTGQSGNRPMKVIDDEHH